MLYSQLFKNILLFSLFAMCVCASVLVCAHDFRCPQDQEGSYSLEQEFQIIMDYPTLVLGTEYMLSERVNVLLSETIKPS